MFSRLGRRRCRWVGAGSCADRTWPSGLPDLATHVALNNTLSGSTTAAARPVAALVNVLRQCRTACWRSGRCQCGWESTPFWCQTQVGQHQAGPGQPFTAAIVASGCPSRWRNPGHAASGSSTPTGACLARAPFRKRRAGRSVVARLQSGNRCLVISIQLRAAIKNHQCQQLIWITSPSWGCITATIESISGRGGSTGLPRLFCVLLQQPFRGRPTLFGAVPIELVISSKLVQRDGLFDERVGVGIDLLHQRRGSVSSCPVPAAAACSAPVA